ncbi:MAG TPA: hypothetical protein VE242_06545 [Chthoniobacterales bacterium]|nr:hypothetical protein [Chthoniobacterales bacterium]
MNAELINSFIRRSSILRCFCALLFTSGMLSAEPVAVRYREGTLHGFLVLRTLEGNIIASGDQVQVSHGDRITSRLVYHFKDGSIDDETAVYSQHDVFRLISDHHIQKGPSFSQPVDISLETSTGQVLVRFTDNDGKDRVTTDHFDFPADLANGLLPTLLKNIRSEVPQTTVSYLAAGPKPLLVKLRISPGAKERFSIGGSNRSAIRYVIKVEIGGILGLLAPATGQQPPDIFVWILAGEAPTFLKWQGPAYTDGPIWKTELAAPVWPTAPGPAR